MRTKILGLICIGLMTIGESHAQNNGLEIPEAFFKVILAGVEKGKPKAIGFIYKNTAGNRPLDAYVNSIDQVERITGYDFYPALPDKVEMEVEKKFDLRSWK